MTKKSKRRAWTATDVHLENRGQKEDAGGEHCPNPEAE
jgi:hypothetical protein